MVICEALQISPEELLLEGRKATRPYRETVIDIGSFEGQIIEQCADFSDEQKRRLLAYISMLRHMKK